MMMITIIKNWFLILPYDDYDDDDDEYYDT